MTTTDDEDEGGATSGRPNLWWQQQREADTFSGSFRGVPTPHAGQQTVHPSDTKGAGHLCWCGQALNHNWAGKSSGTKHPKGTSVSTMTEAPHVNRMDLKGFHRDLQEVIIVAVNQYGVRYKFGANAITLYAKDGVNTCRIAMRNNTRESRRVREWFAKHVIGVDVVAKTIDNPLVKDSNILADDLDKRHAAEEKRQEAIEQTLRDEAEQQLLVEQAELLRLAQAKNSEEHVEVKRIDRRPVPTAPKVDPTRSGGMVSKMETEWVPYVFVKSGEVSELFETNGVLIRCKVCVGTAHAYESDQNNGLSGHSRTRHPREGTRSLWDAEAQVKKSESLRVTLIRNKVDEAIDLLVKATGYQGDSARIAQLEAEVELLRAQCGDIEAANRRADDAEARLALVQEAMRA